MSQRRSRREFLGWMGAAAAGAALSGGAAGQTRRPNIVVIYADDLGYGDVSCYGATEIRTPHVDRLCAAGLRFTNAHAAAATCTPSRFALLTGQYPWREKGHGVLPGNATLIVDPAKLTLPAMLQRAGYTTGVVGKWHLGLGDGEVDWNGDIKPGPREVGFDYSYLIPATGDRVPCVYVENGRVAGLDPDDPIQVSYGKPVGDEPTGKEHPELLKLKPSHGHDQTIVNGVSRIGYMTGGQSARWVDEEMADTITAKAVSFIERHRAEPFFLYFSTHDIHVPRVPHPRFVGRSGMGARGDAILQFDWCVGQIVDAIERLGLAGDTMIIFTSDNGPVLDDGYQDQAEELVGDHKPAGPLRGGKYSAFDAGTRVPFTVTWPGRITPGDSPALLCQLDLFASLATFTRQKLADTEAPDSFDVLPALLGTSPIGRNYLVESGSTLSLIVDDWKYIPESKGPKVAANTHVETGRDEVPQLYHLAEDIGEQNNLAAAHPEKVAELRRWLEAVRGMERTRP